MTHDAGWKDRHIEIGGSRWHSRKGEARVRTFICQPTSAMSSYEDDNDDGEEDWGEVPVWAEPFPNDQNCKRQENGDGWESDDEDADEDEDVHDDLSYGAQHVLLLIDCHKRMFDECVPMNLPSKDCERNDSCKEGGKRDEVLITPFDVALKVAEQLMKFKMHQTAAYNLGKRDGIGVVLYNIHSENKARNKEDFVSLQSDSCNPDGDDYADYSALDSQHEDLSDSEERIIDKRPGATTYELIALGPPGVQSYQELRNCLLDIDIDDIDSEMSGIKIHEHMVGNSRCQKGFRRRDLHKEFVDSRTLPSEFMNDSISSIRVALQTTNLIFQKSRCVKEPSSSNKYRRDRKSIWIFTNDDDPCFGCKDENKRVITCSKDLEENGAELCVWPLPRTRGSEAKQFDFSLLYKFITTTQTYMDESTFLALKQGDLEEILVQVQKQWQRVYRSFSVPLYFPGYKLRSKHNTTIHLNFFRLVSLRGKPNPIIIHQRTGKILTRKMQTYTATGGIVSEESGLMLRKYMDFGDFHVPLTKSEVNAIQAASSSLSDSNYLMIIGFRQIDSVPLEHTVERPYFAYPNDNFVSGSSVAFAALNDSMLRRGVIGIGELLTKVGSTSRVVALFPCHEVREEVEYAGGNKIVEQVQPTGWIVVPLPFEDDIRQIDCTSSCYADQTAIMRMKDIITRSQIYNIEWGYSFKNPTLSQFWKYIEEVALNNELPDPDDEIQTNDVVVRERIGVQIERLENTLPTEIIQEDTKETAKRRRRSHEDVTGIDWREMYKNDELKSCKVDEMKIFLRSIGISASGNKATLVDRISNIFSNGSSTNRSAL